MRIADLPLDSYSEDSMLEYKEAANKLPKSVWETYSAFANTDGGAIVLGIKELASGYQISGVNNSKTLIKEFWDTVSNTNKVSANLLRNDDIKLIELDGKSIIVINVPRAKPEQRPVYINSNPSTGTFRRNGEGDYHCSQSELVSMYRDSRATVDDRVLDGFTVSHLDMKSVEGYRNRHSSYHPNHPWLECNTEVYLENLGAARFNSSTGEYNLTEAGLLMFGREPVITQVFPEYFLDYRASMEPGIRWSDRVVSTSGTWSGNLFDFFFDVSNRMGRYFKVPFQLDENAIRIDDTAVHKSVREALANCIANSDFSFSRGIVITIDDEKIVIQNPGSIRVGRKQMLKGGISDPRNKNIMKMFNLIGIGERAGSGVEKIMQTWRSENWQKPEVTEEVCPDRTILTLPLIPIPSIQVEKNGQKKTAEKNGQNNSDDAKLSIYQKQSQEILSYLEENPNSKSEIISEQIGLSTRRTRYILSRMEEDGFVVSSGVTKGKRYSASCE